jgi:hypothetical protein
MKKKPLEEETIRSNVPKTAPRTSELGDRSLSLLRRATGTKTLGDKEGLDRAYGQGDSYTRRNVMFVAGSHTVRDWYDDVTKIPIWGDVRKSERYQQADKMLSANRQVDTVVGHSLGGSVAHELALAHPGLRTVTYGAPSLSWRSGGERYRNAWDPVSMFDRGAVQQSHPNPMAHPPSFTHDFHNTTNQTGTEQGSTGQENPDGSVSITE